MEQSSKLSLSLTFFCWIYLPFQVLSLFFFDLVSFLYRWFVRALILHYCVMILMWHSNFLEFIKHIQFLSNKIKILPCWSFTLRPSPTTTWLLAPSILYSISLTSNQSLTNSSLCYCLCWTGKFHPSRRWLELSCSCYSAFAYSRTVLY